MMKVNFAYWGLLMVVTGLVACTSTDSDYQDICPEENIKSVKVIARNFEKADGISRTSVTIKNEEPVFSWAENDTIGIFPATGYQVAFPMQSGAGAQVAEFDGGGWALRSTSQYAAYYPYQSENRSRENIYVSYLGQLQNGNKNTQHLGDYDYMAAALAVPEDDYVTFDFKHLGVLLEWRLKMPSSHTLTSLAIQSNESIFMKNGKLSLKNRKPILEPVELAKELTMLLDGIKASNSSNEIIVYMMMAPTDLSGRNLNLQVSDDAGYRATVTLKGQNFEAGKIYTLSVDLPDFVEVEPEIDEYRGKVISDEGGTILLEAFSGVRSQYVVSEDAQEWIYFESNMSSFVENYTIRVRENKSDSTRRGVVIIKNVYTSKAIEYAILQSGKKGYAITETNGRMPIGVLTSNYEPTSEEHGLEYLVDKNLETYFEASTMEELYLDWEGPYPIHISSVQYGRVAGECGMSGMTFHIATDGTDWNGLGWSIGFGEASRNWLDTSGVNCMNRFYRLIATKNNGGSTTRVSEYGLTIDLTDVQEE